MAPTAAARFIEPLSPAENRADTMKDFSSQYNLQRPLSSLSPPHHTMRSLTCILAVAAAATNMPTTVVVASKAREMYPHTPSLCFPFPNSTCPSGAVDFYSTTNCKDETSSAEGTAAVSCANFESNTSPPGTSAGSTSLIARTLTA